MPCTVCGMALARNAPANTQAIWTYQAMGTSTEPQPRSLPGLLGFDLAVARRRLGMQRGQQAAGAGRYLRHGAVEGLRIGLRRLVEAGQLSHELQRGGVDFVLGRGRFKIEQRLDVAAHFIFSLARPDLAIGRRHAQTQDDPRHARPTSRIYLGIEWPSGLFPVAGLGPAQQASSPCPT